MTEDDDDFLDLNSGDDVDDPRSKTGKLLIACRECPPPVFEAMFTGPQTIIPSVFEDEDGTLQNWRDFPALVDELGRTPTVAEADAYQSALVAAEDARRAPAIAAGWDTYDLAELAKKTAK
jgi:hypothetical protein